jgi:8-oxo-(d)GTP phosphatase
MADAAGDGGEIRAAGAVLWRRSGRGIEVALIHRPRYDDWSFPKGKAKPGEHVLETAVREVTEETGLRPVLGRPLPAAHYESAGRPKRVDYWAARPAPGAGGSFQPNDEVDDLEWLPVPEARARLSYQRDVAMLDEFASGPADTVAFTFLRHASAGSKDDWPGDDLDRPLDPAGAAEAARVAPLLWCFGFRRVITSGAERCVATVRPYAALTGMPLVIEPAFTVGRTDQDSGPDAAAAAQAAAHVAAIIAAGAPTVICAHRENLSSLAAAACAALGADALDCDPLPMAGFWVLHAAHGLLAAAEQHGPAGP